MSLALGDGFLTTEPLGKSPAGCFEPVFLRLRLADHQRQKSSRECILERRFLGQALLHRIRIPEGPVM